MVDGIGQHLLDHDLIADQRIDQRRAVRVPGRRDQLCRRRGSFGCVLWNAAPDDLGWSAEFASHGGGFAGDAQLEFTIRHRGRAHRRLPNHPCEWRDHCRRHREHSFADHQLHGVRSHERHVVHLQRIPDHLERLQQRWLGGGATAGAVASSARVQGPVARPSGVSAVDRPGVHRCEQRPTSLLSCRIQRGRFDVDEARTSVAVGSELSGHRSHERHELSIPSVPGDDCRSGCHDHNGFHAVRSADRGAQPVGHLGGSFGDRDVGRPVRSRWRPTDRLPSDVVLLAGSR